MKHSCQFFNRLFVVCNVLEMFDDYFFLWYLGDVSIFASPCSYYSCSSVLYTDRICWRDKIRLHEFLVQEVWNISEWRILDSSMALWLKLIPSSVYNKSSHVICMSSLFENWNSGYDFWKCCILGTVSFETEWHREQIRHYILENTCSLGGKNEILSVCARKSQGLHVDQADRFFS